MQAADGDGDLWLLAPQRGAGPERNLAAVARFETQEFVCRLMPGEAAPDMMQPRGENVMAARIMTGCTQLGCSTVM